MANRLARATSPYLLQHAQNPVDWWPWGDEAFDEARHRDVPVLLSVGYAACHWCHVMAHESFEDAEIGAFVNQHFVAIKVDREERPDVDAVYMDVTTATTGHGGWPMTCFLTPDREAFFAGTYFPRHRRGHLPGFDELLAAVVDAWGNRRAELTRTAGRIAEQLGAPRRHDSAEMALDQAVTLLAGDFDSRNGGFGGAPKFPPSMVLDFLLRRAEPDAAAMVDQTCDAMAGGGMYDQLGGGFARYSVDAEWTVPHFEKMLYDNALLLDVYLHWWVRTGNPVAERVARQTADFLLTDHQGDDRAGGSDGASGPDVGLALPGGGFASALDADSDGAEGTYYVWTPAQLIDVLGEADGAWAAELLGVTEAGTFEHGSSVLQLRAAPDDPQRWAGVRDRLLAARARRTPPARDDKLVVAWNGLAITALARAGALLDPRYGEAAVAAAERIRDLHLNTDGAAGEYVAMPRASLGGVASSAPGQLDDYAAFALGCLTLAGLGHGPAWFNLAERLLDTVVAGFIDGDMFFDAPAGDGLPWRPGDPADNATPAGVSLAADALGTYAALTGRHREPAQLALAQVSAIAARAPRFAGRTLAVATRDPAASSVIITAGSAGEIDPAVLAQVLRTAAWGEPMFTLADGVAVPGPLTDLLAGKQTLDGAPTWYACRGYVCDAPVRLDQP